MARKRRSKTQPDLPLFDLDLPLHRTEGDEPEESDERPAGRQGPTDLTLDDLESPAAELELQGTGRAQTPDGRVELGGLESDPAGAAPEQVEVGDFESNEPEEEEPATLPLFDFDDAEERREAEAPAEADGEPASFRDRLLAGVADLSIIALVMALATGGIVFMEVPLEASDALPLALLVLIFSFLYTVIPLAFWGQTPGMAWLGLMACGPEREPLTFGQTSWRWLGALATLLLAGLPMILALRGDSLSDRLSQSQTIAL